MLNVLSASEQVAQYLRGEIARGRWNETMPGNNRLVRELGVGRATVDAALVLLEEEGLLVPQGVGRSRRIEKSERISFKTLEVRLLVYEESDRKLSFLLDLISALRELGITASFATKTLMDMKMDLNVVTRFVKGKEVDIWLVGAASREILEWFAKQPAPAYALFGRQPEVQIAGVGTLASPAVSIAVERLVELGHERIIMLTSEERRKPYPGVFERRFIESLQKNGIKTGKYNLPDWTQNTKGFMDCLYSLFAHTPPTAIFFEIPSYYYAALQYFSLVGIKVPQDVSMICNSSDPLFDWSEPTVSHLQWDTQLLIRHVLRWIRQVTRGKDIRRQSLIKSKFVEGGTIGPAP